MERPGHPRGLGVLQRRAVRQRVACPSRCRTPRTARSCSRGNTFNVLAAAESCWRLALFCFDDGLREPCRHARGAVVAYRDAGMRRPAVGDDLAVVALDLVVEPEACAADVATASVDLQVVVESGRGAIPRVRLEGESVDSLLAQDLVAASEPAEVLDAGDLEPDQVLGVVRNALRVGLR